MLTYHRKDTQIELCSLKAPGDRLTLKQLHYTSTHMYIRIRITYLSIEKAHSIRVRGRTLFAFTML